MPSALDYDDWGYDRPSGPVEPERRRIDVRCMGDPGPVYIEEVWCRQVSTMARYGYGRMEAWPEVVWARCEYCGTQGCVECSTKADNRCKACGATLRVP